MPRTNLRRLLVQPGQHIYAYCNIRTNQVLYSLSRTLENRALDQLPDIGANHTPPKLRKDIWQPFFTVELPPGPAGVAQGRNALLRLRQWRQLHETAWEPPLQLSRPYTEKEIEVLQKKLDQRGGSKKESVHDIIKRAKKKMRVKEVMNQKEKSVADLAAVLLEHEEMGAKREIEMQEREKKKRFEDPPVMLEMARQAGKGGAQKLDDQIRVLEAEAAGLVKNKERLQRNAVKLEIQQLHRQKSMMAFSVREVAKAKKAALDEAKEQAEAQAYEETERLRQEEKARLAAEYPNRRADLPEPDIPAVKPAPVDPAVVDPLPHLPVFLARYELFNADLSLLPRERREILDRNRRAANAPSYTTSGVTVYWKNLLDSEFASVWPEHVQQVPMIMHSSRHAAPPTPVEEAAKEAVEWWSKRTEKPPGLTEMIELHRASLNENHMSLLASAKRWWVATREENPSSMDELAVGDAAEPSAFEDSVAASEELPADDEILDAYRTARKDFRARRLAERLERGESKGGHRHARNDDKAFEQMVRAAEEGKLAATGEKQSTPAAAAEQLDVETEKRLRLARLRTEMLEASRKVGETLLKRQTQKTAPRSLAGMDQSSGERRQAFGFE